MSEIRKWGLFGRENEAPQSHRELPNTETIFEMDCELTAITSQQRHPSLEQLKKEGEKKLLDEVTKDEELKRKMEDELKGQEHLSIFRQEIKNITDPYVKFFAGKAAELHATGEAKRYGLRRLYTVSSYTQSYLIEE